MSATVAAAAEEQSLIRELTASSFKYSEAPTSNKLTSLRDINSFMIKLRLVFNRFPGVGPMIYSTGAATDPKAAFQVRPSLSTRLRKSSKQQEAHLPGRI